MKKAYLFLLFVMIPLLWPGCASSGADCKTDFTDIGVTVYGLISILPDLAGEIGVDHNGVVEYYVKSTNDVSVVKMDGQKLALTKWVSSKGSPFEALLRSTGRKISRPDSSVYYSASWETWAGQHCVTMEKFPDCWYLCLSLDNS